MLRKLTIAFVVLAIAVLPLTATCVLAADGAWLNTHTGGFSTLPFTGSFGGTSDFRTGGTSDVGTGFFTWCGWSRVDGSQITGTRYPQPYQMTITTAKGDTISLHVPPGTSTYVIDGGTGRFACAGGSGHISLHRSVQGVHGTFTGHLDGNIVLAG